MRRRDEQVEKYMLAGYNLAFQDFDQKRLTSFLGYKSNVFTSSRGGLGNSPDSFDYSILVRLPKEIIEIIEFGFSYEVFNELSEKSFSDENKKDDELKEEARRSYYKIKFSIDIKLLESRINESFLKRPAKVLDDQKEAMTDLGIEFLERIKESTRKEVCEKLDCLAGKVGEYIKTRTKVSIVS